MAADDPVSGAPAAPEAAEAGNGQPDELTAIIREIRDRVRERYPRGDGAGIADLMPLLHARDAALAKVAAIGSINPRPPGLLNNAIQAVKKLIARALDWHVRDQVEFNRGVMACIEAALEALNQMNRTLAAVETVRDLGRHWPEWRAEWERNLTAQRVENLRSIAELQAAFQHRATLMEANFRDLMRTQHADFTLALERSVIEIQKRLWADVERVRTEFERLIHAELRLIRQRSAVGGTAPASAAALQPVPAPAPSPSLLDYGRFAERFRGSEEYVREKQRFYVPFFHGCANVLDIGCGRGEFLELMREAGVPARGVDLSDESVALCRHKGLNADVADLFTFLNDLPESSLEGVFCAQVVEHLPSERLPEMIRLAATRLARNGVLAVETPNPECLAIFATHFYLDPTHTRPIPPALLSFYMEEFGLGQIQLHRLSPAVESMPALASLPADFRDAFFGGLDYALVGRKLG